MKQDENEIESPIVDIFTPRVLVSVFDFSSFLILLLGPKGLFGSRRVNVYSARGQHDPSIKSFEILHKFAKFSEFILISDVVVVGH